MAPISPGVLIANPRKKRKLTKTTKAHRYEPFSQRVANLKIDPVHTVQRSRLAESQTDLSSSHFRDALEQWKELNLSQNFSTFVHRVQPLSESLPQLLHHADSVAEHLLEHIEKRDELSLEPLLSLVAHLAHDLGQSFDKYFERMVKTVAQVSAIHKDAAAIEWCFTCLAWMFKYLSRLLVHDLRPLLDIMIPYLSSRKEYIRRFSAESLAFLIRKAAVLYSKNQRPLDDAMTNLWSHLRNINKEQEMAFEQALMVLFSETMLGVDAKVHPNAPDVMRCSIMTCCGSDEAPESILRILKGTTISLIHQTDSTGFRPILVTVLDMLNQSVAAKKLEEFHTTVRIILTIVGARKGSRIDGWSGFLNGITYVNMLLPELTAENDPIVQEILMMHALTIAYAPMGEILPFRNELAVPIEDHLDVSRYFAFCEIVAGINEARFQELLLPNLQKYIVAHWGDNEQESCLLVQNLLRKGVVGTMHRNKNYIVIPSNWKRSIVGRMEALNYDDDQAIEVSSPMVLGECLCFNENDEVQTHLKAALYRLLDQALQHSDSKTSVSRFAIGKGFQSLLQLDKENIRHRHDIFQKILEQSSERFHILPFLEACGNFTELLDPKPYEPDRVQSLYQCLVRNMMCDSLSIRRATIQFLKSLARITSDEMLQVACDKILELLDAEYSVANVRKIAMMIRRLPQIQREILQSPLLQNLVPFVGLGLLSHYHEGLRRDLCSTLGQMATSGSTGDVIMATMKDWMQNPGLAPDTPSTESEPSRTTMFQCTNVQSVDAAAAKCFSEYVNASKKILASFEAQHALQPPRTPENSRMLALQLLVQMPEVAAKYSNFIIPTFLSLQKARSTFSDPESDNSTSTHTLSPECGETPWSLRDRKMFLELLSKLNNPKALYRSDGIKRCLLENLTNGNPDIRRFSLLALFRWKDAALSKYREQLEKIAEDKNVSTELTSLLSVDEESSVLTLEDRPLVLPVLLRLVFGQLISRSGTHGIQDSKRKAILRLLFRMREPDVAEFLDIALGNLSEIETIGTETAQKFLLSQDLISIDQQYGFLRTMLTMLEILQTQFAPYGQRIVDAVLYCTTRASHQINVLPTDESATAMIRNVRRTGIQCLVYIFEYCTDINWIPYMSLIFDELISPRLDKFAVESSQSVPALLKLFATWAKSSQLFSILADYDEKLFGALWKSLEQPSTKPEVKLFILQDIVRPLTDLVDPDQIHLKDARQIFQMQSEPLLESFLTLFEDSPSKDILQAIINVLPHIAPFIATSEASSRFIYAMMFILQEKTQKMPPLLKGQLLRAIESFLSLDSTIVSEEARDKLYHTVSSLFSYFKDQPNRQILCDLLAALAQDSSEKEIVALCKELNAMSTKHLGEIDHDIRIEAFNKINDITIVDGTYRQWLPLLHNLLYQARHADDFAIRSNAVSCLRRFIIDAPGSKTNGLRELLIGCVLPALKKGVKEDSEIVRADFVTMLGLLVRGTEDLPILQEMQILLVGDDEEASFFANILHIQQHRRARAIRRLVTEVERGYISAQNISEIFLPLIDKFVTDDKTDESDQTVRGQSIAAVSVLFRWLDWSSFRQVFRQSKQVLQSDLSLQKNDIRRLGQTVDALAFATEETTSKTNHSDSLCHLARSLPDKSIIAEELKTGFIPKLTELSHYKDEAEISVRLPAAVVAIKLIKLLPRDEFGILSTPIVLDISQVLRSRADESRDLARKTLAEIVVLLGPSSVQFVVKGLRTALTRGYQRHVLSYTTHTILLALAPHLNIGDLDYCVEDLVSVIMDDIFGPAGQEKDNRDYTSSMKEVKGSKSFDSMELLAKSTSVTHLLKIMLPFKSLLSGSLTTKQKRHIDELLRRVGVGISHNATANKRDLLVFAYQLIQEVYKQKQTPVVTESTTAEKNRARFLVQLDGSRNSDSNPKVSLLFKLAKFAIDMVRSTLSRNSELLTVENVHGFIPIIGDALVDGQEDVKISALRLLSTIIKLPLSELDENSSLYVTEAVTSVRSSASTNDEISQAALKLVTAILRERKEIEVQNTDIAYLLHRLTPDLEDPDRQGAAFNFVKAVMNRKFQLSEVYDVVDKIGGIMITSHSKNSRDAARSVYVHFLLNYPQSKARWSKQVKFLVKNLDYQHPEGRQSIMEAINTLISKIDNNTVQDLVSTMFVPVVLRLANDDNARCRELAGALLSQVFGKADQERLDNLIKLLRSWTEQTDKLELVKIGFQAWTVFFSAGIDHAEENVPEVLPSINRSLQSSSDDGDTWEIQFCALELLLELCNSCPSHVMTAKQNKLWARVRSMLSVDHPWLQSSASSLVEAFFQQCISAGSTQIPLITSYGLQFDAGSSIEVLRALVSVLKRNHGDDDLASKTTRNLLFLGQCANSSNLMLSVHKEADDKKADNDIPDTEEGEEREGSSDEAIIATSEIPSTQYLLDQSARVLRWEPKQLNSAAMTPKFSATALLTKLLPNLSDNIPARTIQSLLIPLLYITDPNVKQPRSADSTFPSTYEEYVAGAHAVLEAIQKKLGDAAYTQAITAASKAAREKREERRTKRRIEKVAEPEKAARDKRRKNDRKKERKKQVAGIYRGRRRADLGF